MAVKYGLNINCIIGRRSWCLFAIKTFIKADYSLSHSLMCPFLYEKVFFQSITDALVRKVHPVYPMITESTLLMESVVVTVAQWMNSSLHERRFNKLVSSF